MKDHIYLNHNLVLVLSLRLIDEVLGNSLHSGNIKWCLISTASGALVVGGVRDTYIYPSHPSIPEIGLSVQWSRTNQSVAVCGSLW